MLKRTKYSLFFNKIALLLLFFDCASLYARDLDEIKADGVLRHIGIPYANFVTQYTQGDITMESGLDVELIKGFAKHLGVRYQYVTANWGNVFTRLNGESAHYKDKMLIIGEQKQPIAGDIIANGATALEWRKQIVDFSDDYFPSAVWLIARADSQLHPIAPSGSIEQDIKQVKALLEGATVLALKDSCLDPDLYDLYNTKANIIFPIKARKLNELIPAILKNDAESTLLGLPDALIALQKWPGEIKVIGPISEDQRMAVAFRKNSPKLREAFNLYLRQLREDGTYNQLVKKYYPSIFHFYGEFFELNSSVN